MMRFSRTTKTLVGLAFLATCAAASAGVTTFGDRTAFNAQGTISENTNFSDFGSGFSSPGNPFTRGSITYTSADNLIVGAGTPYTTGDAQETITNNFWTPLTGTIANSFNLFGFDGAVTSGLVNITVTTNLASYQFSGLSLGSGSPDFTFEGFRATGAHEYFTSFRIDTDGQGYLPGITNVALGIAGAVPEPETYAMMMAGLGLMGAIARRRKAKQA